MPTFDYTCRYCKKDFEELILKKEQKVVCPFCKKEENVVRLVVQKGPGISLKGKGWTGSRIAPLPKNN